MNGEGFAFACWLRWCHDAGITYRWCDWGHPDTRWSWEQMQRGRRT